MPSENARRLRHDQVAAACDLLPSYDRVRVTSDMIEHFAISRDKDQLRRFMSALAFVDERRVE